MHTIEPIQEEAQSTEAKLRRWLLILIPSFAATTSADQSSLM